MAKHETFGKMLQLMGTPQFKSLLIQFHKEFLEDNGIPTDIKSSALSEETRRAMSEYVADRMIEEAKKL